jgi:ABC-type antimicrobial peptide transport system permease subunit
VRYDNVAKDGREQVYLLPSSAATTTISIAMRTRLPADAAQAELKKELRKIDPDLGTSPIRSLELFVADAIAPARLTALLMAGFAGMSAFLAAIGLYAVVSYSVTLRRREIGIRMALGANRRETIWMVLRQGMAMAGAGIAMGLAGSFALKRLLAAVVQDIGAVEFPMLAAIAVFAVLVTVAACWLPAQRAARVDPAVVLRG